MGFMLQATKPGGGGGGGGGGEKPENESNMSNRVCRFAPYWPRLLATKVDETVYIAGTMTYVPDGDSLTSVKYFGSSTPSSFPGHRMTSLVER